MEVLQQLEDLRDSQCAIDEFSNFFNKAFVCRHFSIKMGKRKSCEKKLESQGFSEWQLDNGRASDVLDVTWRLLNMQAKVA